MVQLKWILFCSWR